MFNLVRENGESGHFSTFYGYSNFNLLYSLALFTNFWTIALQLFLLNFTIYYLFCGRCQIGHDWKISDLLQGSGQTLRF